MNGLKRIPAIPKKIKGDEMKKIAFIACTKSKVTYECPAEVMYSKSNLFTKAKEYALINDYDFYILSAKYHLLHKDNQNSNLNEHNHYLQKTYNLQTNVLQD